MARIDDLLRRSRLLQEQQYRATVEARKEAKQEVIRIGDRLPTGQYQVIHPSGSITSNGVKIFNASYPYGQVVRATKAPGQPTIALDWKNVVKREPVEVVEPAIAYRILAFGNYYGFADASYNAFPDNKTFAINLFNWLAAKGKRICTYSTSSLLAAGGDVSIDSPLFYSSLQADLATAGFTISTIDLLTGDLGAALTTCDIFFLPNIISPSYQLNLSQAQSLARFARQGKGLVMVSYTTNDIYTGIADVFGIQSILADPAADSATPVSPVPAIASTLLSGVTSYNLAGYNLIYPTATNRNKLTKLFETSVPYAPEYSLAYAIELR